MRPVRVGLAGQRLRRNGAAIYFATTGLQRLRVQTREDGFSIDELVLSSSRYLAQSPGALKNDTTIVPRP